LEFEDWCKAAAIIKAKGHLTPIEEIKKKIKALAAPAVPGLLRRGNE
jgi:hypothetical protein